MKNSTPRLLLYARAAKCQLEFVLKTNLRKNLLILNTQEALFYVDKVLKEIEKINED